MKTSRIFTDHAIVLKRINWGEADRIVTLLTRRFGKIRALAKGVRKVTSRRSARLEVFRIVTVGVYNGKGLPLITEVESREPPLPQLPLPLLSHLYLVVESVERLLPDHEPHPDIYEVLSTYLGTITTCRTYGEYEQVTLSTLNTILERLGFVNREQLNSTFDTISYIESILERSLKSHDLKMKLR